MILATIQSRNQRFKINYRRLVYVEIFKVKCLNESHGVEIGRNLILLILVSSIKNVLYNGHHLSFYH